MAVAASNIVRTGFGNFCEDMSATLMSGLAATTGTGRA
jgi:hypothetical protein